ncbi:type III PLP-dependent enzyme [Microbulbifer sp. MCCC 1A16149]|uniref:type III PLP-dependent enzyme n=1 Tax=Microbulbifer sp. MCCC 1A16149 TaxID=3411322 RepID=UPI003D0C3537
MKHRLKQAIESVASASQPVCAYIYDLADLQRHIAAMRSVMPENTQLYYAAKANPDRRILAALAPWVEGFEAASGGELDWLYETHPEMSLIFGGPGKLESELASALDKKVEYFHVESLTELHRLAQLSTQRDQQVPILLRMNIPLEGIALTKLAMGGKPSPFGLDPQDLDNALTLIRDNPGLSLQGFHFHMMSHQLCADTHLQLIELYFSTFRRWCEGYGLHLPILNVGGGMGIDYGEQANHFDWERFCRGLAVLMEQANLGDTKVRFECGRFISAACGYYVMEVLDIKHNHGEYFAIGHGGTHHFRTPAAQSHDHPFFVLEGRKRGKAISHGSVTLVGQLCTPKDVLAARQPVNELAIGDYLVFPLAGAYAWNISHQNFLMHAPPQVCYLD